MSLAFAPFTFRASLRDIETGLRAVGSKRSHAVFRGRVSRSRLFEEHRADANRAHDGRIDADCARVWIGQARRLYVDDAWEVMREQAVSALDSTTIDLCLALFPWARFDDAQAP